ncbi:MAG TPA: OmpA family protein [Candidatus Binatia bacterium]|nr:OmpA family protein [Candidatus Binatia bacterium]
MAAALLLATVAAAYGQGPPDRTDGVALDVGTVLTVALRDPVVARAGSELLVVRVAAAEAGNLTLAYTRYAPGAASGVRTVAAADRAASHRLSAFWADGEAGATPGWTAVVVSTDVLRALRAGERTPFAIDGPRPVQWVERAGDEALPVLVNDEDAVLRTLVAQGNNGFRWWILDRDAAPLVLRTDNGWVATVTSIAEPAVVSRRVADGLRARGEVTTHGVLFAPGSAELREESRPVLDAVGRWARKDARAHFAVEDYGAADAALSLARAERVKRYLVESAGVDTLRIVTAGRDGASPVAPGTGPEAAARNRRMVFRRIARP